MPAPAPNDKGGRPPNLSLLARKAMRVDGPKWVETLRRDAGLGDATAIQTIIALAMREPSKPPT